MFYSILNKKETKTTYKHCYEFCFIGGVLDYDVIMYFSGTTSLVSSLLPNNVVQTSYHQKAVDGKNFKIIFFKHYTIF